MARDPRPPCLGLRWAGCYRGLSGLRLFARLVVRVVFLESRAALLAFPYSAVELFAQDVRVPGFAVASLFAAAALMATGLFVAAVAPGAGIVRGVGAILFYLVMFFAGLWLPIPGMPPALQHISHATPLGAAVPAMQNATRGHRPAGLQLVTMAASAVAFGLAAARLFRWE